jgi:hypothetical protein
MAGRIKEKYIGARVDEEFFNKVLEYIGEDYTQGDLVRAAVKEYMINHPTKEPTEPTINGLKPGA